MISIYRHAEIKCFPRDNGVTLNNRHLVDLVFDTVKRACYGHCSLNSDLLTILILWVQLRHPYCDLVDVEAGVLLYFQNIQSIQKVYIILVTVTKMTRTKNKIGFYQNKLFQCQKSAVCPSVHRVLLIPDLVLRVANESAQGEEKILCYL